MEYQHTPVLLNEVIENMALKPGQIIVDGTVGGAGHAQEILKRISPGGKLIGFDMDPDAIAVAGEKLKKIGNNFELINDNFANLEKYGKQLEFLSQIHAILLDLGISSYEIGSAGRGFSFQKQEDPLDLRMNPQNSVTAATILNTYSEDEIKIILQNFGQEPLALQIARRVATKRKNKKFETVKDLLQVIDQTYQGKRKPRRIHPATRTWQALRIAVNRELENIEQALPAALKVLKPNGILAVISFHSLEDRIVKRFFRQAARSCICPPETPICNCQHDSQIKIITKKPIIPTDAEIQENRRSRSAKLRIAQKL